MADDRPRLLGRLARRLRLDWLLGAADDLPGPPPPKVAQAKTAAPPGPDATARPAAIEPPEPPEPPEPRREPAPLQDLRGGRHALSYLRHLARGNRLARRRFYETVSESHPPVLLLHGFLGTRGSMWPLEQRLAEDGFVVFSFNLGTFNSRDIRTSAFLIHRKIESILAQTQVRHIDIVGHSMGGLIGLYYVKKLGGAEKVRKLVMMGTPMKGTWSALAGVATLGLWSASSWQLLPGSRFLKELATGPLPRGVEITTIAAERDWVCPPASTELAGADTVRVPLGHSSLVVSGDVYQQIRHALGAGDGADDTPGAGDGPVETPGAGDGPDETPGTGDGPD